MVVIRVGSVCVVGGRLLGVGEAEVYHTTRPASLHTGCTSGRQIVRVWGGTDMKLLPISGSCVSLLSDLGPESCDESFRNDG